MSKAKFIEVLEELFKEHVIDEQAMEYFNKTIKAKRVDKKSIEKGEVVKNAILEYLQLNTGKMFDRVEIGNALYNAAEFSEEFLLNEKGQIAFNSITAYANQLVNNGLILKGEVRVGKTKKVKYWVADIG